MENGLRSPLGELVRRADPDRWFTVLFAPADRHSALLTLYAFNHELARAREVVREPFAALVRLQWWREVVEGARRRHEVAEPLGAALDAGLLDPAVLEGMITAREAEAEGFPTVEVFEAFVRDGAGGVMVAAARALGMEGAEALRPWGAAYGVAGVLRSIPAHARQGRCVLPLDLLDGVGLSEGAVIAAPNGPALAAVRDRLSGMAQGWLRHRVDVPAAARAAALPVVLARRDLGHGGERTVWDKAAVTAAALLGRL